jgi:hypothetical protein
MTMTTIEEAWLAIARHGMTLVESGETRGGSRDQASDEAATVALARMPAERRTRPGADDRSA